MKAPLLSVRGLRVTLPGHRAPVLSDIAFDLAAGGTLGIVGESGSGKSLLALALAGLLPQGAEVAGEIRFEGRELTALSDPQMDAVRGARIAMVFQEPATALNPAMRIGRQVAEGLRIAGAGRREAEERAFHLLERVRIPQARERLSAYPHELSGGQRQRVAIAAALARSPALLVADEPTTALDATVQAEILDLLAELTREDGMAMILVSHDLGVVSRACASTLVLYAGTRFEEAATGGLLTRPRNPYSRALIASMPRRRTGARLPVIPGTVPRFDALPPGCRFAPRCALRIAACEASEPEWRTVAGHGVRCIRAEEVS